MIYLDNAATTPLSDKVLQTLIQVSQGIYGNPSSTHTAGRKASQILRQSRQTIAALLEVKSDQIYFTSGGSEADNLALQGYALAHQKQGKHIITTAIEHHAVLHSLDYLKDQFGFDITYIRPRNGRIEAKDIKEALRPDTIVVSVMYANNETGDLLPIAEIGQLLKDHPAVFHVDAVQTIGKLRIHPRELGIDFLAASAHKFHGPKGVGFLYAALPQFDALIHGGNQENKHRAGTENLAAIAAMATALEENLTESESHYHHVKALGDYLLERLKQEEIDYQLNQSDSALPYVLNLSFPGQLNEQLLMRLDMAGIALSTGSACTAGAIEPSHVLTALYGSDSPKLRDSIRISLSALNKQTEIEQFITELKHIIKE